MHQSQPQSGPQSRWNQGLGVSTLAHLILIGGLSLLVAEEADSLNSTPQTAIETRWSPTREEIDPTVIDLTPVTYKQEESSSAAVNSPLLQMADRTSAPDKESLSSRYNGPLPQSTQFEESPTTKHAADIVGALLTSDAIGGATSGSGNGTGNGNFFGINPKSKKIVYVVDSSKSMNFLHESEGKTRLGRVKLELARAILSMDEQQEFFVIFFSDVAIPMPANRLQPATKQAKSRYLNWIARVPGVGRTEPLEALLLALRLQPDTIYFLTDGQFNIADVKTFNTVVDNAGLNKRVTVNGICFGNREGEKLLRELAENNSGAYTFIP